MDNFLQRKQDVLKKADKSSIGEWDKHILKLCDKINKFDNYYTTSSCSGKAVIMLDEKKKKSGLFLYVYHDALNFQSFRKDLNGIGKKELIKFKQEPPILHIHCRTLDDAQSLLEKAQLSGWKKSGIISFGKRIILELNGTEKLEFLIMNKGKVLVDEGFLKLILGKCNENLKFGWKKIDKLKKIL